MNAHSEIASGAELDIRALRDVLGQFATGVTVVTTRGDHQAPVGLTANSFTSVSMDPPLVAWNLNLNAPSLSAFRNHPSFAINILCAQSKELAMNFSRPADDKFADVDWRAGLDGVPILDAAVATIECQTETRILAGDHEMYLGRVMGFRSSDKQPLVFHKGQFASLGGLI
jgi:flavin reductase (DIM6/NTAB) family NADH-FMN oxidoreductase RutF